MNKFLLDNHAGKTAEREVADLLERNGHEGVHIMEGYYHWYDIVDSKGATWEIKFDIDSKKTPNYFIEYGNGNKKSGISITTAKTFVIVDEEKMLFVATSDLKGFLKENWGRFRRVHDAGDNGRIKGILVPKATIIKSNLPTLSVIQRSKDLPVSENDATM